MEQVNVVDHPLVVHKLTQCRRRETETWQFRGLVEEITAMLLYEAVRDIETEEKDIVTPVTAAKGKFIKDSEPVFIAVLRAGLGMVPGALRLFPYARAGHIGLYRDHDTHVPVEYYCNLPPNISELDCFLLEPMLATGGSATHAISVLKKAGAKKIKLLSLIAAPEGIKTIISEHPDIKIYLASLDEKLNENAYIVPGLGDAGDRLFGTA
ncbi:MAG: uracil phosphoribosyltransferase [Bacillota bacterium]|nr:uracil phosphoribosyltransferase [Bacillota bacterium]MDW7729001.1 uracil phosphoribosyltransferase [Bacillota bacterium]